MGSDQRLGGKCRALLGSLRLRASSVSDGDAEFFLGQRCTSKKGEKCFFLVETDFLHFRKKWKAVRELQAICDTDLCCS